MPTRLIVLLVCSMQLGAAAAQDAGAPSRVQRVADNPLRMIIEAGKIRPRTRTAEADKAAATREPERIQVRARPPAASADAAPPALPAGGGTGAAAPTAPAEPAVAVDPGPAPAAVVETPTPPAGAPTAASETTETAGTTVPAPAAPAEPARSAPESQVREVVVADPKVPAVEAAPPEPAPLQIAHLIEPVVPRRLIDKVRGNVEVVVSFTVQPDGSVGHVAVQQSSHPQMNPTVLETVAQWRYAPIPAARQHAVQLLMRAGE